MQKIRSWRIFWAALFFLNWAVILFYWFDGAEGLWTDGAGVLIALGRIAGLAAGYMILLQFFLMGRMPFLERVWGLDKLSRLHQFNGKYGIFLLLLHPILVVAGYSLLTGTGFLAQYLLFVKSSWHILFASIGLALFVIVILSSLVVVYKRLRYESWYFVHLMVYLAVLFAFWHQIELGGTLLSKDVFYAYWVALYVIVFGGHIVFRFARPVYLFWKHKFFVEKIVRETPSTVSVYISGNKIDKFNIHSGQFMIFRFLTKRMWWQAHPFSLSMMPDGKRLRITVKELGDFTREVKDLEPGTKILIDGPYGVFTDIFSFSSKVLFIAGGIGITPIRSLAEEMLRKGKQVTLLYANRTESDITFRRELEDLTKHYPLQLVHVLSDDPDFAGEKGWVDEEKLQRLVPDLAEREVYLCGPVPMMLGLLSIFKKLKLKKPLIHYERFSLHV